MFFSIPHPLVSKPAKHLECVITKQPVEMPNDKRVPNCTYTLLHVSVIHLRRWTLQPPYRVYDLAIDFD